MIVFNRAHETDSANGRWVASFVICQLLAAPLPPLCSLLNMSFGRSDNIHNYQATGALTAELFLQDTCPTLALLPLFSCLSLLACFTSQQQSAFSELISLLVKVSDTRSSTPTDLLSTKLSFFIKSTSCLSSSLLDREKVV